MIRIVCWNTQHKRDSWNFLCERHGEADLALLQEACTPTEEAKARLDVGPGPWVLKWSDGARSAGVRAVVRISNRIAIERVAVADIVAMTPNSAIDEPIRFAVAIATLPSGERIGLVSIESGYEASQKAPEMIREIQQSCADDLPWIVGGDLNIWPNSKTTMFGDMMRIGLPLIGPHAATYYNPPLGQKPSDANIQNDYVFASRSLAHRLTVRALNDPNDWGPSDHCRIVIDLEESPSLLTKGPTTTSVHGNA